MEPNANQPSAPTGQSMPTAPTLPPQPEPTSTLPEQPTLQQPSTSSQTPVSYSSSLKGGKGKMAAIIGVVLAVLIAATLAVWFLVLSPSAQAKKASTEFMSAATSGDKEKLYKISDATTDEDKNFLSASSDSVKGSYKLTEKTSKNNTWYYLYELSGAPSSSARTEVEKKDGKYVVTGFVYGKEKLALIPANSTSTDTSKKTETPTATTENTSQCLVLSDFDPWYKAMYGMTATSEGLKFDKLDTAYTSNHHFEADSLSLEYDNSNGLSSMVDLAKSVANKEFKIRLRGSVATTLKSDLDFANKRAQAVKDKLVLEGVSASKIVIDTPGSIADYGAEDLNNEVAKGSVRVVVLTFDPTCSGSAADSGSNR